MAVAGAVYGINAYDKIDALKNEEYKKGVLEGRKQIYYNLPKDSQKFIEKNTLNGENKLSKTNLLCSAS